MVNGTTEYSQTSQSNKNNDQIEAPKPKKSDPPVAPTNAPVNENQFVTASDEMGKIGLVWVVMMMIEDDLSKTISLSLCVCVLSTGSFLLLLLDVAMIPRV